MYFGIGYEKVCITVQNGNDGMKPYMGIGHVIALHASHARNICAFRKRITKRASKKRRVLTCSLRDGPLPLGPFASP